MSAPNDLPPMPQDPRQFRRGIFLLPSIITVGNMFCGYACIVFAMRGELVTAAPFIGFAVVLDMLDGRIARMTNTTSAFGLEFDSLADVISFGLAPAILAFAWGLSELGRVGWAAGFVYVTAAAMRLARFNIQTQTHVDKRYFVGMPSPSAAGVVAATVYAWPYPLEGVPVAAASMAVVLVPAVLMVSTIRFRSFKTINFGWTPSYINIILVAGIIALVATSPRVTLVILAYGYLLSAFVEMAIGRFRTAPLSPAAPPET
ncbi:MAG: CDP-diacylglycerol--serine O-phosphatidyltransferase [Acidobacteriota bacterium]|jgi:CDP-diacylglycerol--serine O-phosphatidyltransferase